jgi:hypothetical protein
MPACIFSDGASLKRSHSSEFILGKHSLLSRVIARLSLSSALGRDVRDPNPVEGSTLNVIESWGNPFEFFIVSEFTVQKHEKVNIRRKTV